MEKVEQAKAYAATGMSQVKIAEVMGIHRRTVQRYLQTEDSPELALELSALRRKRALDFADKAWDNAIKLNTIMEEKIAAGHSAFKDAREVATCLGIYLDKINILESRGKGRPAGTAIQINIMPPGGTPSGNPIESDGDTVQVYDESDTVFSDGSGSGERKNLYRLPAGRADES